MFNMARKKKVEPQGDSFSVNQNFSDKENILPQQEPVGPLALPTQQMGDQEIGGALQLPQQPLQQMQQPIQQPVQQMQQMPVQQPMPMQQPMQPMQQPVQQPVVQEPVQPEPEKAVIIKAESPEPGIYYYVVQTNYPLKVGVCNFSEVM